MYFLGFDIEDVICASFHGHICNQQDIICRYTKFKAIGVISLSKVHAKML